MKYLRVLLPLFGLLVACQQAPSVLENSLSNAALGGDDPYVVSDTGALTTPALGAPVPLVLITTFEDFQCPFCRFVGPTLERVLRAYPEDVQAHFRHRPLSFHPLAIPLSRATMAAHRQGHFQVFKDVFFSRQHIWMKRADGKSAAIDDHAFRMRLVNMAEKLGLDVKRFSADLGVPAKGQRANKGLGSKEITDKIAQDNAKGILLGARGTPTVFVNGRKIRLGGKSQSNHSALVQAVRSEIAIATKLLRAGLPRHQVVAKRIAANNADKPDAAAWLLDNADVPAAKLANAVKKDNPRGSVPQERVKVPLRKDAPMKGAKDTALVTIIEFSDFQCGYCARVSPTLDALVKSYPKAVRVAYLNLPLGFHKQARPAAIAAICAQQQGKFWPYHDALFANMRQLDQDGIFKRLGTEVGLKAGPFKSCLSSKAVAATVDADTKLAGQLSVRGTPHMFINGRRARGALPLEQLQGVVEEEIAKWSKVANRVGTGDKLYQHIMGQAAQPAGLLTGTAKNIATAGAAHLGPAKAPVKVAVFSDFECPYCARVAKPLHDLSKAMPNDVAVYFKHFPLSFHKKAEPASIASICAQRQGKFWPYHDKIFGSDLSNDTLDAAARFVGLDMTAYAQCKADPAARKQINDDMADGRSAGVRGTPSIFINGRKFNGRPTVASLRQAVEEAQKRN